MGVAETVGIDTNLLHLVEEKGVLGILVKEGTEVIEATCSLRDKLRKQPGKQLRLYRTTFRRIYATRLVAC